MKMGLNLLMLVFNLICHSASLNWEAEARGFVYVVMMPGARQDSLLILTLEHHTDNFLFVSSILDINF